jgi:hypothetical protein
MKKALILFLTLAILAIVVPPVMAQETSTDNFNIELNYMPTRLEGDRGFSADLNCINVRAEANAYRGLKIGARYSFASGGNGNFPYTTNRGWRSVSMGNVSYSDLEAYVKVPFNLSSLGAAYNDGQPTPPTNPFYVLLGYKTNYLNSNGPPTNTNYNWENGNGAGAGVGFDGNFEGVALYGLFAYYPSMNANNVPNAVPGASYTYKDYVYRAGLRFKLRENIEAHLGYAGETHEYSNANLRYNSVLGGVNFKF